MQEAYVEVADGQMYYQHGGAGKPLIFLHSLGRASRSYQEALPILAESYAVYALDSLGHGRSSKPKRDFLIPDFSESVAQLMAALKIPKAVVVGNSIGATIALDLAARRPELVEKLVLVGCPGWTTQAEREERYEMHRQQMNAQGQPKPYTMDDIKLNFRNPTVEMLAQINEDRAMAGEWLLRSSRALMLYDPLPTWARVKCPTSLIYGRQDMLLTKAGLLLYEIKTAEVEIMDDAGHLPQVDDPQVFCKLLTAFVNRGS